jgi:hypothetical protein
MGTMPVVLHGGERDGQLDLVPSAAEGATLFYPRPGFGRLPSEEYVVTDEWESLPGGGGAKVARFVGQSDPT